MRSDALSPLPADRGGLLPLATACAKTEAATPAATAGLDDKLALSNPNGAATNLISPSNYPLVGDQHILSYHRDQGNPN